MDRVKERKERYVERQKKEDENNISRQNGHKEEKKSKGGRRGVTELNMRRRESRQGKETNRKSRSTTGG